VSVSIVSTGIANIASVQAAFRRLGVETVLTGDPDDVRHASHVMLPGVGAFGPGMATLKDHGLDEALSERAAEDKPLMAICLGLQLLGQLSEESPGVSGLGVYPGQARRFSDEVRVPHFGWNAVEPARPMRFLTTGYAYFANSYRVMDAPLGWDVAWTEYDGPFVAAMERGNLLACQFHPELSGPWGLELLRRWASC
jgi:imidazole glycerol phosphate synthase glutamine amidotransferase subunit